MDFLSTIAYPARLNDFVGQVRRYDYIGDYFLLRCRVVKFKSIENENRSFPEIFRHVMDRTRRCKIQPSFASLRDVDPGQVMIIGRHNEIIRILMTFLSVNSLFFLVITIEIPLVGSTALNKK